MRLASNLDLGAARPLWTDLSAARRQPLDLDASDVQRLGGLCLQVLLAARACWSADGVPFRITNPSEPFLDALRLMAAEELLAEAQS